MYFNETIEKKFFKTFDKSETRTSSETINIDGGIHIKSIKIEGQDGPMVFLVFIYSFIIYSSYWIMITLKLFKRVIHQLTFIHQKNQFTLLQSHHHKRTKQTMIKRMICLVQSKYQTIRVWM